MKDNNLSFTREDVFLVVHQLVEYHVVINFDLNRLQATRRIVKSLCHKALQFLKRPDKISEAETILQQAGKRVDDCE